MRLSRALVVGSTVAVIAVAALMSVVSAPSPALSDPIATDVPTTVVIPESSSNSTLQPAPTGVQSGTAAVDPQPSAPPTNADGSPVAPSEPVKDAPKLALNNPRVEARGWMTITGTGFKPGEKVQVVVYSSPIVVGSFLADGAGGLSARFLIPAELRPGSHTIEATGWISRHVMNVGFSVVTATVAGAIPAQLWILVVLGVLFVSAVWLAIFFRRSIARRFRRGSEPAGSAL